jgi:hypothetical protein
VLAPEEVRALLGSIAVTTIMGLGRVDGLQLSARRRGAGQATASGANSAAMKVN